MTLSLYDSYFFGFGLSAVFPFVVGVWLGVKRALRSSLLD